MGLTYPSLAELERIARQREVIAELERALFRDSCRLSAHNIIKAAPMPWASSIGTDVHSAELPHWVKPEEVASLNLTPRRLWQEIEKVLFFHQWPQEDTSDEEFRLRVGARAVLLDVMVGALEGKVEKERQKLAVLMAGRVPR